MVIRPLNTLLQTANGAGLEFSSSYIEEREYNLVYSTPGSICSDLVSIAFQGVDYSFNPNANTYGKYGGSPQLLT
jgi:hypothetical protein